MLVPGVSTPRLYGAFGALTIGRRPKSNEGEAPPPKTRCYPRAVLAGVRFTIDDGSVLIVSANEVKSVADALRELTATPGAISCAAQLDHARRQPVQAFVDLTAREGGALRLALEYAHAPRLSP
jgi:hypothetical protein